MNSLEALVLAIIEGLTEFLPVSSTGHLVVAEGIMGIDPTAYVKGFTVIIQLGAILSVVVLYYKRFFLVGDKGHHLEAQDQPLKPKWNRLLHFYGKLLVGIIPAVILGLLFNDWVDRVLGNVWVIIINLIIGGIFMIFIDKIKWGPRSSTVSYKQALLIGFWQCIAIFLPGISRSMATIVGGLFSGLDKRTAAEFSFFLAVPTMFGATVLQVYKLYKGFGTEIFTNNATSLIIGNVVSFVVAMIAIRFFVDYISRKGFKAFGVYRIIFASVVAILLAVGITFTIG